MMLRSSFFAPSLTKTSPFFSLILKIPFLLVSHSTSRTISRCKTSYASKSIQLHSFSMNKKTHFCTAVLSAKKPVTFTSTSISNKARKKAMRESPEGILRHKLDLCSKNNDVIEAFRLYDEARTNNVQLGQHHYNVMLYLCSSNGSDLGLKRGFDVFQQMVVDKVDPNEATFTSAARLAVAIDDPDMAFELIKQMKSFGIPPRLRSYGPALFGFCNKGKADKAYEVDAHMVESGVIAEEPEISALLKVSAAVKNSDKVYEMLQRLRTTVRQVSELTTEVIENWFTSDDASNAGVDNWDARRIKEAIVKGGGGWHGEGWLGSGKWKVVRTEMDEKGVCSSCGEKLVCIDIDPMETENFAVSLAKLACQKEVKSDFNQFQDWLKRHGPFDAVIDGANCSLVNQKHFNFYQLDNIVNQLQQMSPSKKLPLVILHRSRVTGGPAQNPKNKNLLERWKTSGALYATPAGSNDDWYWLYAAVSCKSLLVTNDEMRDHLFQLLGNSFFPRWKEKHQVRLMVSRKGLDLRMPPPYSIVIQEAEKGSWHVPTTLGDDLQTSRQWLCASRPSKG